MGWHTREIEIKLQNCRHRN